MQDESKHDDDKCRFSGGCVNPYTESLVIHRVLGHADGYPLRRVRRDLNDLPADWIEDSIKSLEKAGVVVVKDEQLHMAEPLKRLDDLDMICI